MNIAIIGASLPGQIVAVEAALYGDKVTLYGDPERARSRNPIGPQYLWHTPASVKFFKKLGFENDETKEIEVVWARRLKRVGDEHIPDEIRGYNEKTGSSGVPCKGVKAFTVFERGLEKLHATLGVAIANLCGTVKEDVTGVEVRTDYVEVATRLHTAHHDAVANTLTRDAWQRLRGHPVEPITEATHFHWARQGPYHDAKRTDLVYNGDKNCPWFRCSASASDDGWVYESKRKLTQAQFPHYKHASFEAKFAPGIEPGMQPEPRVTHVGRWAEMRKEMLVDDVLENARHYRTLIEKSCY